MEHGARVVMLRQHQNFHKAAQEHQRRTREAVNQAVDESLGSTRNTIDDGCTGRLKSTTSGKWLYENGTSRIDSQVKLGMQTGYKDNI